MYINYIYLLTCNCSIDSCRADERSYIISNSDNRDSIVSRYMLIFVLSNYNNKFMSDFLSTVRKLIPLLL